MITHRYIAVAAAAVQFLETHLTKREGNRRKRMFSFWSWIKINIVFFVYFFNCI